MKSRFPSPATVGLSLFILLATVGWLSIQAQSIPPPMLTITALSTNRLAINITNGVSYGRYDIYTTPDLTLPANLWTAASAAGIGTNGQTNFVLDLGPNPYPAGFFRAVIDTNSVPFWQLADYNHPELGILNVFIDCPTNGFLIQ